MTSIRTGSQNSISNKIVTEEIEAIRGDYVSVPLKGSIPSGATVRVQLRQSEESLFYYILDVIEGNIVVPVEISSVLQGKYIFDVEMTYSDLTVKTVQRVVINFTPDVTRIYGDELPFETSDIERRRITATEFNVRLPNNNLEKLISSPNVNRILIMTLDEFNQITEKEPNTLYLF